LKHKMPLHVACKTVFPPALKVDGLTPIYAATVPQIISKP